MIYRNYFRPIPYRILGCVLAVIAISGTERSLFAQQPENGWGKWGAPYKDPERWEAKIREFEERDLKSPPPEGAVVVVGSSSIGLWRTIHRDLAPLTVIHRGFGGSNYNDLLHFTDRLVVNYKPRAVVVYEGDNDAAGRRPPGVVFPKVVEFVLRVHEALPDCRIYFLSAKPSPLRFDRWDYYLDNNLTMEAFCRSDDRLAYVDIASAMLGEDGSPLPEIYAEDRNHMNEKGYEIWTRVLREQIIPVEAPHEAKE